MLINTYSINLLASIVSLSNNSYLTVLIVLVTVIVTVGFTLFIISLLQRIKSSKKPNTTNKQNPYSFDSIISSLSDGVLLLTRDGTIRHSNQAAASILGWPLQDIVGLRHDSIINLVSDNPTKKDNTNPISQALIDTKIHQVVKQIEHKEGRIFVDISVSPLLDEQSILTGVVVILRNIDEQKKQEMERSDFISTASHEMRTPVAAIRGYLELTLNPKICQIDNKARDYLQKSLDATDHLGGLFQDLLTISQSEDGRLPHHPEKVNINNLLSSVIDQIKPLAEEKGLKVVTSQFGETDKKSNLAIPAYHSFIDPNRFREVVSNIFNNATKYTHEGSVTIKLSGDSKTISIAITDTGPGIPEVEIPHLFQKFYRVDNSDTREIGGTGLGLYICKQIVDAMRGSITVSSSPGQGATFTIHLPRVH